MAWNYEHYRTWQKSMRCSFPCSDFVRFLSSSGHNAMKFSYFTYDNLSMSIDSNSLTEGIQPLPSSANYLKRKLAVWLLHGTLRKKVVKKLHCMVLKKMDDGTDLLDRQLWCNSQQDCLVSFFELSENVTSFERILATWNFWLNSWYVCIQNVCTPVGNQMHKIDLHTTW